MVDCFNQIAEDPECRVVVFSGAGKLFTSGKAIRNFCPFLSMQVCSAFPLIVVHYSSNSTRATTTTLSEEVNLEQVSLCFSMAELIKLTVKFIVFIIRGMPGYLNT